MRPPEVGVGVGFELVSYSEGRGAPICDSDSFHPTILATSAPDLGELAEPRLAHPQSYRGVGGLSPVVQGISHQCKSG